jgi:oligopeptidase B
MLRLSLLLAVSVLAACAATPPVVAPLSSSNPPPPVMNKRFGPPVAEQRPFMVTSPFGNRPDPYYWLRDDTRKNPDVLAYLTAENDYTRKMLEGPTEALRKQLYDEIVGRIQQDDSTVPVLDHGFWYYTRYQTGSEYPIYARRAGQMTAPEQVLLDANLLAKGLEFFQFGTVEASPNQQWLAYSEDTSGRRQYRIKVKDLKTGETQDQGLENVESSIVWADDNRTFLYIEKNPETLLGFRVRKHVVGSGKKLADDPIVYEEKDPTYYLGISASKSEQYLYIISGATNQTEWRAAKANDPSLTFTTVLPRQDKHEYDIEHWQGDQFVVRSNLNAENFQLWLCSQSQLAAFPKGCTLLMPHDKDTLINDFTLFNAHIAVSMRQGGLNKLAVLPLGKKGTNLKKLARIEADDPAYTMSLRSTPDLARAVLRYTYTSPNTPSTTFEQDLRTGKRTLLKQEAVLGGYKPENYATEFVFAPARDGVKVPVSLVYKKTTPRDGSAPLYVYGYGSYGISMDPAFNSTQVSLLDRGFVLATLHVRGGQEMGRQWFENGRLQNKQNTFNDFIDATEFLVSQKYGAKDKVFARGGSAGGLLMGAIANQRPDLYKGIIAQVPFVDVVTTMLDESIPLTTNEFDQWGNPSKDKAAYDTMLSYSPYDNVKAQAYPAMLVMTGLWDSQVQYYEPAKWVARLRTTAAVGSGPLYFKTEMNAGHGGKSGRYQRYQETALYMAFMLAQLGPVP